MRRYLLSILALLSSLLALSSAPVAATQQSPEEFMQTVVDGILKKVKTERSLLKEDQTKLRSLVTQGILPYVDFPYLSQLVLGRYWKEATPAQREEFMASFQDMLLRTYADALLSYDDQSVRYLPSHNEPGARDVKVNTEIVPKTGQPIPVIYRVYLTKTGEWKVFDITVEGISLVTNYRNTFTGEIQKVGLEGLIKKLKTHNIEAVSDKKAS
jgi:phospholipid transport system substrate-binding protein